MHVCAAWAWPECRLDGVRRHVLTFSEIPILISYIRYIVIDELPSRQYLYLPLLQFQ